MAEHPRRKLENLEETTPEAWRRWRLHFTTVCAINDWPLVRRKRELVAAMQGGALDAVSGLDLEPDNEAVTQEIALGRMAAMFVTEQDSDLALTEFEDARQKPGETELQYHVRLANLYRNAHANVQNVDQARPLIIKFVSTLSDARIMTALHGIHLPTYAEAKQATMRASASIARQARASGAGTSSVTGRIYEIAAAGADEASPRAVHAVSGRGRAWASPRECYCCGATDNLFRDCKQATLPTTQRTPYRGRGRSSARGRGRGVARGGVGKRPGAARGRGRYGNTRRVNALGVEIDDEEPAEIAEEEGIFEDHYGAGSEN